MGKRMTIAIILLVVVFGGIFGFGILRSVLTKKFVKNFKFPPATISTVTAKSESWHSSLPSVGSMAAINGVNVTTEVSGIIKQINFTSGKMVKFGDSLVQLDNAIDVQDLSNSQAQFNLDQLDFNRKAKLFKTNAISKSDYDQSLAALKQSQAQVNKSLVSISQKDVRAPFSGKVGIRQVNLGQYINPGDTVVTLQSLDPLYVNFSLPEQFMKEIHLKQEVDVTVDAYPGKIFKGKITAINAEVTKDTRGIDLQGTVPNPDLLLYPGSFANVNVILPVQNSVITLPQTAVTYSLYGDMVYIVKAEGKDNKGKTVLKAYQQYVKIGERVGTKVAILKGLKVGDVVVSSGQLKLTNGRDVSINNSVKLPKLKTSQLVGS
jgi:membrane fusion protein (multidrug efflux system)